VSLYKIAYTKTPNKEKTEHRTNTHNTNREEEWTVSQMKSSCSSTWKKEDE